VFELLGPTVDLVAEMARTVEEDLEPGLIFKTSEQLLEAIAFIHEAGYVHGGMVGCSHCSRPSRSWLK
jgi:serine/threonine-protein kinase SRPK3